MRIVKYLGRRLLLMIPVLLGVTLIAFGMTRLMPGDPIAMVAGPYVSEERKDEMRREAHFDKPFYHQFAIYVGEMVQGEWGTSYYTAQPVSQDLAERFPATFELVSYGMLLALVLAVPLGIAGAVGRGTWVDHVSRVVAVIGVSAPIFWLGLVLLQLFYFKWGIAPAPMGRLPVTFAAPEQLTGVLTLDAVLTGNWELFRLSLRQLFLPVLCIALTTMAPIARMTRSSMIDALDSNYVRAAQALGLSKRRIIFQHALKNASIPILTMIAAVYGYALGGLVLVESVFAWPGVGFYGLQAIMQADFPAVQGFIVLLTVQYVLIYLILDVLITFIDRRVAL